MRAMAPDPNLVDELAVTARAGDRAALAAIYATVAQSIFAWARVRVRDRFRGHIDPADLTQDIWLRAMDAIATFDPQRSSFRAWLFRVAKNVLLEQQRTALRRMPGPAASTSNVERLQQVPDGITSITRRVARDESVQLFLQHIGELGETDRRLVLHCGLEEMSLRETAAMLAIDYDAVAKRWQRLRERLRSWQLPTALLAP